MYPDRGVRGSLLFVREVPHEPVFPGIVSSLTRNFPEICGVVPNLSGLYGGDIVGAVAPTPPRGEGGIANEIVSGLSLKYARKTVRFPGKCIGAKISLYSRK